MSKHEHSGNDYGQDIQISVVIPMFNGLASIGAQLDALAVQTAPLLWEVIVADNASTDHGPQLVRDRVASFPVPLRVVDASGTRGAAHARNRGVSEALGQLVIFCDSDDIVGSRWLESAVIALAQLDVVTGPIQPMGSPREIRNPPAASFGLFIMSGNFGIRRDKYELLGGFDENLPRYGGEDADFSIRCSEAGLNTGCEEEMLIKYRPPAGFRESLRKAYFSGRAEIAIWQKHRERFPKQLGFVRSLRQLLVVPKIMLASKSPKSAARILVVRVAHVVGQFPYVSREKIHE